MWVTAITSQSACSPAAGPCGESLVCCLEESYSPIMTSWWPDFYHILQAPAQLEKAVQGSSALWGSSNAWHFPATFSEARPPTSRLLSLLPHSCHLQAASLSAASQPSSSLKLGLFLHPTSVFALLHFTSTFTTPPLLTSHSHLNSRWASFQLYFSSQNVTQNAECHLAGHGDLLGPNPHPLEVPVAPDPAKHALSKRSASLPWAGPPPTPAPQLRAFLRWLLSSHLVLPGSSPGVTPWTSSLPFLLSDATPFCPSHFYLSILAAPKCNSPVFLPSPPVTSSSWPFAPVPSQG